MSLLDIHTLTVEFGTARGPFRAVDQVNLSMEEGSVLGIVGESGSGKSVSMLALMGLIPFPGKVMAERLEFAGNDLMALDPAKRREMTGKDMAMVFQEPLTSLNPCFTAGFQIMEALKSHEGGTRRERRERAIELLKQVGIPAPETRLSAFPHQLSGGMNQRVMIAMAIACNPRLLIADEPTTALDVTIQAQILDLMMEMQVRMGLSILFITHDLAVVSEAADDVAVMYAGRVVETGPAAALLAGPRHPYTCGLIETIPGSSRGRLPAIPGTVPDLRNLPPGCRYSDRCPLADEQCRASEPGMERAGDGRGTACWKTDHD